MSDEIHADFVFQGKHQVFANLKKEYIREIRAILHNCKNDGIYITAQKYVDNGLCNNKYIKKIIYDSDEKKKMEVVIFPMQSQSSLQKERLNI